MTAFPKMVRPHFLIVHFELDLLFNIIYCFIYYRLPTYHIVTYYPIACPVSYMSIRSQAFYSIELYMHKALLSRGYIFSRSWMVENSNGGMCKILSNFWRFEKFLSWFQWIRTNIHQTHQSQFPQNLFHLIYSQSLLIHSFYSLLLHFTISFSS